MPHPDLGGYVLGGLTDEERVRFEADLARDPTLRRDVDDLAGLPHLLDLAALVDGDGDDDVDVPAHVVAMTRSTAAVDVQPRRRMGPLLAAVAAVAMLLGLAGGVLAGRDHAPRADREVALVVVDSTAASSARGSAALFRQSVGVGVRLRLSGLSPTEPGSRYECWWIGRNGRVVAGSFQVGADGTADVRLNVAGSLDGSFRLNVNKVANGTETRVLTAEVS